MCTKTTHRYRRTVFLIIVKSTPTKTCYGHLFEVVIEFSCESSFPVLYINIERFIEKNVTLRLLDIGPPVVSSFVA